MDTGYIIGVFCAIGSGIINNLGVVLQKKVVNELPEGEEVGRNLLRKPLWVFAIIFQYGLGSVLFLIAYGMFVPEWRVGAALVPGLMASGLIVLAVGSIKILGEKLRKQEVMGILFMIIATTMLGFSELETEVTQTHLEEGSFMLRIALFTVCLLLIAVFCEIYQRRQERYRGILYAISSGSMFATTNYWTAVITALFAFVFGGQYVLWFIIACIILILTNIYGVLKMNQGYQYGQAANLIPIQQVPVQITPIFVYFVLFLKIPDYFYAYLLLIGGVALIIVSSFLLAQRQAKLEEIQ